MTREKAHMIWKLRQAFKIGLLIEVAGIPRSAYYYCRKEFESPVEKTAEIKAEIRRIYDENKERYSYRRITNELQKCMSSITKRFSV